MIDYIKATKHLQDKDTPFFGHCIRAGNNYIAGYENYWLMGCTRIDVLYKPSASILSISGSIMYYWQGHNFTYDKSGFVSAIKHIGTLLHVDLWDAMIEVFEYGKIIEVPSKPRSFLQHHTTESKQGFEVEDKCKGYLRTFTDKSVKLKMYDAGRNIKYKQGLRRKEIIKESGWNPEGEHLKWEAHYLRPEILNHGLGVRLADLVNPNWENVFKEDLYLQYKRLVPMRSIIIPTNKKELSTADIFAIQLVEDCINEGKTIQEVRKMLYARINSISDDILSKADKDSRKRQVKALLEKIKEEPESKWDLSAQLEKALLVE